MPDFDTTISYCLSAFIVLTGLVFVAFAPFVAKEHPSRRWTRRQCIAGYVLAGIGTITLGVWLLVLTLHGQTHVFIKSYP